MSGIVNALNTRGSGLVAEIGTDGQVLTGTGVGLPIGFEDASAGLTWDTTAKTGTVTAAAGNGYFVNTTSGGITVNLPAGSAGDMIGVSDYAKTFDSNACTVAPNGSEKIRGSAGTIDLATEGQSTVLVYVDGTQGWIDIHDSTAALTGMTFMTATGGAITTSGNFKMHSFNSPGTFGVSAVSPLGANNKVSYMVAAGGGSGPATGGGEGISGGGGAGGYREGKNAPVDAYTASPTVAPAGLTVSVADYPITIGGGGAHGTAPGVGSNGANSVFSSITSAGGGRGGRGDPSANGVAGGSGGGGDNASSAGAGNTPPTSPAQGTAGGASAPGSAGGGGGATVVGTAGAGAAGGAGGAGATTNIIASPVAYSGGGGGGSQGTATRGAGGTGGGQPGTNASDPSPTEKNGAANLGGGGGGSSDRSGGTAGGNGGSGIVIIRYRYQ